MKRIVVIAAMAGLACVVYAGTSAQMSVQVRNGQLRAAPSFVSKPVGPVEYGLRITVLSTQGAWKEVETPSKLKGWIHESSLTPKKLALANATGAVKTGTSANEVSLAAKGFTSQIEHEYKAKNPATDFTWVDRMEHIKITPERAEKFLKDGGVVPAKEVSK